MVLGGGQNLKLDASHKLSTKGKIGGGSILLAAEKIEQLRGIIAAQEVVVQGRPSGEFRFTRPAFTFTFNGNISADEMSIIGDEVTLNSNAVLLGRHKVTVGASKALETESSSLLQAGEDEGEQGDIKIFTPSVTHHGDMKAVKDIIFMHDSASKFEAGSSSRIESKKGKVAIEGHKDFREIKLLGRLIYDDSTRRRGGTGLFWPFKSLFGFTKTSTRFDLSGARAITFGPSTHIEVPKLSLSQESGTLSIPSAARFKCKTSICLKGSLSIPTDSHNFETGSLELYLNDRWSRSSLSFSYPNVKQLYLIRSGNLADSLTVRVKSGGEVNLYADANIRGKYKIYGNFEARNGLTVGASNHLTVNNGYAHINGHLENDGRVYVARDLKAGSIKNKRYDCDISAGSITVYNDLINGWDGLNESSDMSKQPIIEARSGDITVDGTLRNQTGRVYSNGRIKAKRLENLALHKVWNKVPFEFYILDNTSRYYNKSWPTEGEFSLSEVVLKTKIWWHEILDKYVRLNSGDSPFSRATYWDNGWKVNEGQFWCFQIPPRNRYRKLTRNVIFRNKFTHTEYGVLSIHWQTRWDVRMRYTFDGYIQHLHADKAVIIARNGVSIGGRSSFSTASPGDERDGLLNEGYIRSSGSVSVEKGDLISSAPSSTLPSGISSFRSDIVRRTPDGRRQIASAIDLAIAQTFLGLSEGNSQHLNTLVKSRLLHWEESEDNLRIAPTGDKLTALLEAIPRAAEAGLLNKNQELDIIAIHEGDYEGLTTQQKNKITKYIRSWGGGSAEVNLQEMHEAIEENRISGLDDMISFMELQEHENEKFAAFLRRNHIVASDAGRVAFMASSSIGYAFQNKSEQEFALVNVDKHAQSTTEMFATMRALMLAAQIPGLQNHLGATTGRDYVEDFIHTFHSISHYISLPENEELKSQMPEEAHEHLEMLPKLKKAMAICSKFVRNEPLTPEEEEDSGTLMREVANYHKTYGHSPYAVVLAIGQQLIQEAANHTGAALAGVRFTDETGEVQMAMQLIFGEQMEKWDGSETMIAQRVSAEDENGTVELHGVKAFEEIDINSNHLYIEDVASRDASQPKALSSPNITLKARSGAKLAGEMVAEKNFTLYVEGTSDDDVALEIGPRINEDGKRVASVIGGHEKTTIIVKKGRLVIHPGTILLGKAVVLQADSGLRLEPDVEVGTKTRTEASGFLWMGSTTYTDEYVKSVTERVVFKEATDGITLQSNRGNLELCGTRIEVENCPIVLIADGMVDLSPLATSLSGSVDDRGVFSSSYATYNTKSVRSTRLTNLPNAKTLTDILNNETVLTALLSIQLGIDVEQNRATLMGDEHTKALVAGIHISAKGAVKGRAAQMATAFADIVAGEELTLTEETATTEVHETAWGIDLGVLGSTLQSFAQKLLEKGQLDRAQHEAGLGDDFNELSDTMKTQIGKFFGILETLLKNQAAQQAHKVIKDMSEAERKKLVKAAEAVKNGTSKTSEAEEVLERVKGALTAAAQAVGADETEGLTSVASAIWALKDSFLSKSDFQPALIAMNLGQLSMQYYRFANGGFKSKGPLAALKGLAKVGFKCQTTDASLTLPYTGSLQALLGARLKAEKVLDITGTNVMATTAQWDAPVIRLGSVSRRMTNSTNSVGVSFGLNYSIDFSMDQTDTSDKTCETISYNIGFLHLGRPVREMYLKGGQFNVSVLTGGPVETLYVEDQVDTSSQKGASAGFSLDLTGGGATNLLTSMSMGAKGGSNQVVNAGKAALGLPKGSLPEGDTPGSVVKKIVRLPVEEFRRKWDVSVTVHAAHWGKDDATANKSGTDKGTSGKGGGQDDKPDWTPLVDTTFTTDDASATMHFGYMTGREQRPIETPQKSNVESRAKSADTLLTEVKTVLEENVLHGQAVVEWLEPQLALMKEQGEEALKAMARGLEQLGFDPEDYAVFDGISWKQEAPKEMDVSPSTAEDGARVEKQDASDSKAGEETEDTPTPKAEEPVDAGELMQRYARDLEAKTDEANALLPDVDLDGWQNMVAARLQEDDARSARDKAKDSDWEEARRCKEKAGDPSIGAFERMSLMWQAQEAEERYHNKLEVDHSGKYGEGVLLATEGLSYFAGGAGLVRGIGRYGLKKTGQMAIGALATGKVLEESGARNATDAVVRYVTSKLPEEMQGSAGRLLEQGMDQALMSGFYRGMTRATDRLRTAATGGRSGDVTVRPHEQTPKRDRAPAAEETGSNTRFMNADGGGGGYSQAAKPHIKTSYSKADNFLPEKRSGKALKDDGVSSMYDRQGKIIKEFPGKAKSHGFPDIIDNYASHAKAFDIPNGKLYQLEGAYNGKKGRFEWIVQDNKVTHRMFVEGGKTNGIPIKK